jgi:folate-dependent tRNA-U54 methylase TrmFO/GidA
LALSPRDNHLKVQGVDNLFCAGEKVGLMVGHTEAIVSGTLAGHNAARRAAGKPLLELPDTTAVGDIISFVGEQMRTEVGRTRKYTFSGSVYFERMNERGLYSLDRAAIAARVEQIGLAGVFAGAIH